MWREVPTSSSKSAQPDRCPAEPPDLNSSPCCSQACESYVISQYPVLYHHVLLYRIAFFSAGQAISIHLHRHAGKTKAVRYIRLLHSHARRRSLSPGDALPAHCGMSRDHRITPRYRTPQPPAVGPMPTAPSCCDLHSTANQRCLHAQFRRSGPVIRGTYQIPAPDRVEGKLCAGMTWLNPRHSCVHLCPLN